MTALSDGDAIRNLVGRYGQTVDDGRFDELAELFVADGVMEVMGVTHRGAGAVAAFMRSAQPPERRGRHVTVNTVVVVTDEGSTARATSDFLFVDRTNVITTTGRYHDRFVRTEGGWRFAARRIELG